LEAKDASSVLKGVIREHRIDDPHSQKRPIAYRVVTG
jgi:hypothetical protein